MNERDYAAIILAAGYSSRMRAFKPLLQLGTGTLIDRVISSYFSQGIDVYVVVGHKADDIRRHLSGTDVTVIANPNYEMGMFSSIQAGVESLPYEYRGVFIHPVDIPLVLPSTVSTLVTKARTCPDCVIFPTFEGRRGHPVLLPARLRPRILEWHGDGGLKALLAAEPQFLEIAMTDANILFDVDTQEAYEEMLRLCQEPQIT